MPREAFEDIYGLSPLQQGMLFHILESPQTGRYFEQFVCELEGELDVERFQAAWQRVIERHAVLRTSFVWQDVREPVQIVHRRVEPPWRISDWRHLDDDDRERRWRIFLAEDQDRGFALDRAPLLRFHLARVGERTYRLVWSYPHLLLDGWSMPIVLGELFEIYRALGGGQEPGLAPAPAYRDYILWLKRRDADEQIEFWRRRLAGFTQPTPFPVPPASETAGAARSLERALDEQASAALRRRARAHRVTASVLAQAAWAILLGRWAAVDEVVFGIASSGRPPELPGVGRMVGLFINTVPGRVRVAPSDRLGEWLQRLQEEQTERLSHDSAPLWEVQAASEVPAGQELFRTLFVFENYPLPSAGSDATDERELVMRAPDVLERTNFPLTLGVALRERFSVRATFDPEWLPAVQVERLMRQYLRLVEKLAAAPDELRLGEIDVLLPGERHQLLHGWSRGRATASDPRETFLGRFRRFASAEPERPAAIGPTGEELSYGELARRAAELGRVLREHGAGPERPVGILLSRGPELFEALLGVLEAGSAFVLLDPDYPPARWVEMVVEIGTRLVVSDRRTELAEHLPADAEVEILGLGAEVSDSEAAASTPPDEHPLQLGYVIFTSGSTGRPKPVGVARHSLDHLMRLFVDELRVGWPGARVLGFSSVSFDASICEYVSTLGSGATLVFRPPELLPGEALSAWMRRQRIRSVTLPPSSLAALPAGGLDDLETVLAAGEQCAADLADRWAGERRMFNAYGPTEATVCSSAERCVRGGGAPPIGRPMGEKLIYLVDHRLRLVPAGAAGEIAVGGEHLARGYLRRPAATAAVFVPDPFSRVPGARLYRSGDLARMRSDGRIDFLGRRDRQVKVRGFRIEPAEVEAVLRAQPGVREAVVDALPGDRLCAWIVAADGAAPPAAGELREALGERLPAHLVPTALVFVDELPRMPSGKIDRRRLSPPEHAAERAEDGPRTALEAKIAAIWREVLGLESVGVHQSFFEIGGHSLRMVAVHGRLERELGRSLPLVELLRHPTIAALAERLQRPAADAAATAPSSPADSPEPPAGEVGIAIIGLAGRFPGARNAEEFWRHLCAGVESIRTFDREELEAAGYPAAMLDDPAFVPAAGVLAGAELFDADFFGLTPREARLLDPQHRLFLEGAVEALDDAGYGRSAGAAIGVFAGCSLSGYGLRLLMEPGAASSVGPYQATLANDKDFLTTRVSHRLDLRGPSLDVQTACSTSLVAVHLACRSLLAGECEMALAGGVSVAADRKRGYLFQEGGIGSPDGHCRPFDARAAGTVSGEGLGVVVLKRLDRALADGDTVRAVIRGSAINNDGASKVGYTAPSVEGQKQVIERALAHAGWGPDDIDYVETHGTATALGDVVEAAALGEVFAARSADAEPCRIGAVKSNIGHADAAAGIAGLIKAVLALEHATLPPSLHYERPNPRIDFAAARLEVVAERCAWPRVEGRGRRAAVSSFGIGGTNAHVVLEQAPPRRAPRENVEERLLVLSARTSAALEEASDRLLEHLHAHPELALRDVAYTLGAGRRGFAHRRAIIAWNRHQAIDVLALRDRRFLVDGHAAVRDRPLIFLFPGQGQQRPRMAERSYRRLPAFRRRLDRCAEILEPHLGLDLRQLLFPEPGDEEQAAQRLESTELAQPALFAVEICLAQQLIDWGIEPAAMIGHSLGELVAATLAGVFSLEDALELVAIRGRLMQDQPQGAMLALSLGHQEALELVGDELSLAAVNAPRRSVVSGPSEAIEALRAKLAEAGAGGRLLRTSHAFHSPMMRAVAAPFAEHLGRLELAAPRRRFVSNVTGDWIDPERAVDPDYWVRHLLEPVLFARGVETAAAGGDPIFVELGPGRALSAAVRATLRGATAIDLGGDAKHERSLPELVARLFVAGADVDPGALAAGEGARRVPLPAYPFERRRFWIDSSVPRPEPREEGLAAHAPVWKPAPRARQADSREAAERACWLLADERELAAGLEQALEARGCRVVASDALGLGAEDLRRRARTLAAIEGAPPLVVLALTAPSPAGGAATESWGSWLETRGAELFAVLELLAALAAEAPGRELSLRLLTRGALSLAGEPADVSRSALEPMLRVATQESPNLDLATVDLEASSAGTELSEERAGALASDLLAATGGSLAYRGAGRWRAAFERLDLAAVEPAAPREGVVVITGGLGRLGLVLARHLGRAAPVRCVLLNRGLFPDREDWDEWLEARGSDDRVSRQILAIRSAEDDGACSIRVLRADVADPRQLSRALHRVREQDGRIGSVFHLAGNTDPRLFKALAESSRHELESHLRPKVGGVLALQEVLAEAPFADEVERCVLFSSLSAVLGGLGYGAYAAANAAMDAMLRAESARPARWTSIAWEGWDVGEEAAARGALDAEQALALLDRVLALDGQPWLVAARGDLAARRRAGSDAQGDRGRAGDDPGARAQRHLDQPFEAPQGPTETLVAEVWSDYLGIEKVGRNDDFFELGGDSLLATEIMARLRREVAIALPLASLLESPTVAHLARQIDAGGQSVERGERESSEPATVVGSTEGASG